MIVRLAPQTFFLMILKAGRKEGPSLGRRVLSSVNFQRVTSQETLGVTRCERSPSDFVWCTHESSWHPVVQPFFLTSQRTCSGSKKYHPPPLSSAISTVEPSEAIRSSLCLVATGGCAGMCCLSGRGLILGPKAAVPIVRDGHACQRMCLLWLFLLDSGLRTSCLILLVWLGGTLHEEAGRASGQPFHV